MINRLNQTILCAVLTAVLTTQADAAIYAITFNDGKGNVGSGQINVLSANNSYYAASGYLDVTGGGASGIWTLYTARGNTPYPGYIYSPSGGYIYNNAVYVTRQNPQYPTTNPLLDDYGLLFTQNNGNELNLWGNANGTYTLGGNVGGWQNFNVSISFGGTTITPVPEPATILAALLLLVPIGAGAFASSLRKKNPQ